LLIERHGEATDTVRRKSRMLNKAEQNRAPNSNEKPENFCCSALAMGPPCLPCYTRGLAGERRRPVQDAPVKIDKGRSRLTDNQSR
jgi:hypothetical protein